MCDHDSIDAHFGGLLKQGEAIGYVGDTGNAKGKPPHLHYEILSVVPLPWRIDRERLGWLKAFHLNPSEELLNDT